MQSVQSMQKHERAPQNHGSTAQVRLPALHTLHSPPLHTLQTCTPCRTRAEARSPNCRHSRSSDYSPPPHITIYIYYILYYFIKGMQSVQSMQKHKRAPQNHGFTAQVRLPGLHTLHTRGTHKIQKSNRMRITSVII